MRKRLSLFALVAGIAAMPLCLYILSAGPIIFIKRTFGFPDEVMIVVERTYQPLSVLYNSNSIGGRAFRAYIHLWFKEVDSDDLDITMPSGI